MILTAPHTPYCNTQYVLFSSILQIFSSTTKELEYGIEACGLLTDSFITSFVVVIFTAKMIRSRRLGWVVHVACGN